MRLLREKFRRSLPVLRCFALLMSGFPAVFGQTAYYISSTGNDTNNGRSTDAPFQSLAKVNSLTLQAGDQVLFRRGDTFRGTLLIRQSGAAGNPIVVDAYGSGNKPVLAGSIPLNNWTSLGNNRWQTTCSTCSGRVTGLYRTNNALPLGRYPNSTDANKGYLTIQSHQNATQITSQQALPLNLNTGWNGAEVVIRARQWITDRYGFNGQSGNGLNLVNPNSAYDIQDGWGFFIQNHPATLDQEGEWAFDSNTKTLQLYTATGNPNSQSLTVTALDRAIDLSSVSNVTLRNLNLSQALSANLYVNSSSNLTFSNLDILNAGEDGVSIVGSGQNVLMENNTIHYANNNGVGIALYQNVTFRGNAIRQAGVDAGRSKSGDGQGNGLSTLAEQSMLIENNVIDSVGYNGISFTNGTTIQKNVISNFCLTKSDGGGIYTWNGNKNGRSDIHVLSNVVYNGIGAPQGTPGGAYSGANGLYFDDCTQNAEATNNTIFNCAGLGIFLHATSNLTVKGNTSYNNGEGQLALTDDQGRCLPRSNSIQNNLLVSRLPNQIVARYESNANDLNQYGSFDNNYYIRPFDDVFKVRAVYSANSATIGADLALTQWQSQFNQDLHSQNSPLTYSLNTLTLTGNPLRNDVFNGDTNGWATWSPFGNGRAEWDNGNKLDGGSLRVSFPSASNQANSYVLVTVGIGAVVKGKTYQFDFDALGTGTKRVEAFIRQQSGSYSDLAPRAALLIGTNRQHYTAAFTAIADESNAILVFQVYEDGQTIWLDNTKLQEATSKPNNPDDFIQFIYNATAQNTSVNLTGNWRDVKNQAYSGSLTLAPFSSFVLLKDTSPSITLRDPENPASAINGLEYAYFEGDWNNLPDFNALTAVKTGNANIPDLSMRNRDDQFGLRFKGYITIPTDGTYTFYTTSDDGSKLYIGNTEIVNNDGLHAAVEQSGTIGLKAGKHAVTVVFFEKSGGQELSVSYGGPGLSKQVIPATAFYRVDNSPSTALRDPENPANVVNGLDYAYYEGDWNNLPDFNALTAVKTGSVSVPSLSVRNRDDQFGLRFKGYITIPTDGSYTFYTTSDDGSKLYIGTTEVVNNEGAHAAAEQSGTVGLKAGKHAVTVAFFEKTGDQVLSVSYSGPGLSKQVIPATAFYHVAATSVPVTGTGTGLRAEYFNNTSLTAPIVLTRTDATVNFDWGTDSPASGTVNADNFSVRWTGQVEAPVSGNYTFSTNTDDGVRLWVNGVQLINDWNGHAPTTNNGTALALTAGQKYDIRMAYFEGAVGAVAKLLWAYPSQAQQIIPQSRLYPATTSSARETATGLDELKAELVVQIYPIPARDEVRFKYVAEAAGQASVQLINAAAQGIIQQNYAVTAGENVIRIPVREFSRGFYVLVVTQGNRRIKRKVILAE